MITVSNHPAFKKLLALGLNPSNYAVFGSGPMYLHDIKDHVGDIDIVARGDAWELAQKMGKPRETISHRGVEIDIDGGSIQVFNEWVSEKWNVNELIDTAEVIDGIRFVQLDKVLEFKLELNRPKDIADIAKLKAYLLK